jgi:hypothetical protein
VRHLAATEADPFGEDSPLMALARAGALALVSRVEVTGSAAERQLPMRLDSRRTAGNSTAEGLWS